MYGYSLVKNYAILCSNRTVNRRTVLCDIAGRLVAGAGATVYVIVGLHVLSKKLIVDRLIVFPVTNVLKIEHNFSSHLLLSLLLAELST